MPTLLPRILHGSARAVCGEKPLQPTSLPVLPMAGGLAPWRGCGEGGGRAHHRSERARQGSDQSVLHGTDC
eukprot:g6488.t1